MSRYPCPTPHLCGVTYHLDQSNCRGLLAQELRDGSIGAHPTPLSGAETPGEPRYELYVEDIPPETYQAILDVWEMVQERVQYPRNCGETCQALRVSLEQRDIYPVEMTGDFVGGLDQETLEADAIPSSREYVWLELDGQIIDPTYRQFEYNGEMSQDCYANAELVQHEPPEVVQDLVNGVMEEAWDLSVDDSSGHNPPGTYVTLQQAYDSPELDLLGGNCLDFSVLVHQDFTQGMDGWSVVELAFTQYAHAANVYTEPESHERWVVDLTLGQWDPRYSSSPAVMRYSEWKQLVCKYHEELYQVQLL